MTADNNPVGERFLFVDFPTNKPGVKPKNRVSKLRFKPCLLQHDTTDMPEELAMGLSQYVLTKYAAKAPSYHTTVEGANGAHERVVVDRISDHKFVRGQGDRTTVMYQAHWIGIMPVT